MGKPRVQRRNSEGPAPYCSRRFSCVYVQASMLQAFYQRREDNSQKISRKSHSLIARAVCCRLVRGSLYSRSDTYMLQICVCTLFACEKSIRLRENREQTGSKMNPFQSLLTHIFCRSLIHYFLSLVCTFNSSKLLKRIALVLYHVSLYML